MSNSKTACVAKSMAVIAASIAASVAGAATPQAAATYTLSVFATAPSGLSAPDSVAVGDGSVFIGYGDNHLPDGSDGLDSQVVQFSMTGTVEHIYTVHGHNDGVKIDPYTHAVWALQNEDANPNLVIIDPFRGRQSQYVFGPTPHGGGYDDIVFRGCKVYLSASNPANNPNTKPAIVSVELSSGYASVAPVLLGTASAIDLPSGQTVALNLQDPDSMTLDPLGNIVLDSQADHMLITVAHPDTAEQRVLRLPLSYQSAGSSISVETDDTAFTTSTQGFLLFADKVLNNVYKVSRTAFAPGVAYTAADGGPFVGALDTTTGVITPVVTGVMNPGGMQFVDTSVSGNAHGQHWHGDMGGGRCDRDSDRDSR